MSIESLAKMVPFFSFPAVEKLSVDAVKHDFVAMKVDHMKGAVIFSTLVSQDNYLFLGTRILNFSN